MIKKIGFLAGALVTCILLVVILVQTSAAGPADGGTTLPPTTTTAPLQTTPPPAEEPEDSKPVMEEVVLQAAQKDYGSLAIVDVAYQSEHVVFMPITMACTKKGYTLTQEAQEALERMMEDYTGHPLAVLYARSGKGPEYDPSCYDGVYASGLDVCFQGDANGLPVSFQRIGNGRQWLYRHCIEYGFIPCNPTSTGEEGGHFRYVGVPHASVMTAQDLTLSGYLAQLRNNYTTYDTAMTVIVGQIRYHIFYVIPDTNDTFCVMLPDNCAYQLSGDCRGGIIVTVSEAVEIAR